jgi:hypothetical protein
MNDADATPLTIESLWKVYKMLQERYMTEQQIREMVAVTHQEFDQYMREYLGIEDDK